jgi:hypothetical protein
MLQFVNQNEGLTNDEMAVAMFHAFGKNYGDQYKVSVNVWEAKEDDYKQGFSSSNDWGWLADHESGYSYFIAVRPIDAKPVPIFFNEPKNYESSFFLNQPMKIVFDILKR